MTEGPELGEGRQVWEPCVLFELRRIDLEELVHDRLEEIGPGDPASARQKSFHRNGVARRVVKRESPDGGVPNDELRGRGCEGLERGHGLGWEERQLAKGP